MTDQPPSPEEFYRAEQAAKGHLGCKVCNLDPEVRADVERAYANKIPHASQMRRLKQYYGIVIGKDRFAVHFAADHERA